MSIARPIEPSPENVLLMRERPALVLHALMLEALCVLCDDIDTLENDDGSD